MAWISNQTLRGDPKKKRGHHPVSARVRVYVPHTKWSKDNRVVVRVEVIRDGGDYQFIDLIQQEANVAAWILSLNADSETRLKIALDVLKQFDDSELLAALKPVFSRR